MRIEFAVNYLKRQCKNSELQSGDLLLRSENQRPLNVEPKKAKSNFVPTNQDFHRALEFAFSHIYRVNHSLAFDKQADEPFIEAPNP